jgi:hypothetical protein
VEAEGGREVEQDKGGREGGNGTLEQVKSGALAYTSAIQHYNKDWIRLHTALK